MLLLVKWSPLLHGMVIRAKVVHIGAGPKMFISVERMREREGALGCKILNLILVMRVRVACMHTSTCGPLPHSYLSLLWTCPPLADHLSTALSSFDTVAVGLK